MLEERLDYSSERQRHRKFVGRTALLATLDQHLVAEPNDRWVVVTGGPGMGKSALLAAWLASREAEKAVVPHHFIHRATYDWDDPAKLVGSLVAQIEVGFPGVHEQDGDERMHPATRLDRALVRVSERVLGPTHQRLVVLIDGLDEYDPPTRSSNEDPLAAFLPYTLPPGVRLLCASRPREPYVSNLAARDGELVQIDLDDPARAANNEATVRELWEEAAARLGLDARFVDEAVARAKGNVHHAVQLRKHLAVLLPEQRRVEDIPQGHAAMLERSWRRIAIDPAVVDGLGVLCAAREALTLDELGTVARWTAVEWRWRFERAAGELLLKTRRPDGEAEYRIHNDSIRGYIAQDIGKIALRAYHAALVEHHATWPLQPGAARSYALRHALAHRAEAGAWGNAWRLAADTSFLVAKSGELGVHETEADLARMAERSRASNEAVISRRFDDLTRALGRESHWLRALPDATGALDPAAAAEATTALVWNRLRRFGWSVEDLEAQLRVPAGTRFLHVRHAATRESPALVRDLVDHAGGVAACAVTRNGRLLISASDDRTLKLWDLESGRILATLDGHTARVNGCAVTKDGRRLISASDDRTLKVWDLDSRHALATLDGHTEGVNACAVTPDGRHVVSASKDRTLKIWNVQGGPAITTLEGHSDAVTACAVTVDDRRVVSASADRTLKIWNLEGGRALATLEGHTDRVTACAMAPDGKHVVSASEDRALKIWDLASGCALATLEGHTDPVRACAVTPDGRRIVSASDDRKLKVWNFVREHAHASVEGHTDWVIACAVTPDRRRVVSASQDGTLRVWNLEDGRTLTTLVGHTDMVMTCAVTSDGKRVVSGSRDRTLKLWNIDGGDALATLEGHTDWVMGCAITADDLHMISASQDGTLKVWDLERRCDIKTLRGHGHGVTACVVMADGRRVVSASYDHSLKVWDRETGIELATLNGHTGTVMACAAMADGQRVISASSDKTLKIWDLETEQPLHTLQGHTDRVWACTVTPDSRHLVSASNDQTLRVWDLQTRSCLFTHRGDAPYLAVAASPAAIVAGDRANALWFLDWPPSPAGDGYLQGSSGDRDVEVVQQSRPPIGADRPRSVIAVIGIDRYAEWPRLGNARHDAAESALLFRRLGFVEVTPPLLDEAATRDAMHRLVTTDLQQLDPEGSLVLFFAGHGHTRIHPIGNRSIKTGYVIPVDGGLGDHGEASWLRLDNWLREIARLPPRHILVFIDACHSGVALNIDRSRGIVPQPEAGPDELQALQRRISRRVITSALDDQRAADGGIHAGHSLFTGFLIEGLSGGLAEYGDRTAPRRRVVTGRDIGQYLHERVRSYTKSAQTPDSGEFDHDERGDIVVPILDAESKLPEAPRAMSGSPIAG